MDFADTSDFGADVNYTGDTSVTFTDSSVNSSGATAYTFSSQAIGTASSDRVVAVGVSAGNSAAGINTLTVGGVSAVKAIDATNSTETELWYASVPSGTTADIVVTFSSSKGRCGIGVWALTGVTGVGATNTSTSSTATLTVSGRAKDIILAVYGGKDHASVTFTGLTEDYDEDISGAGSQYQAGGSKKLTATGSNTITVTPNTGATEVAAVSAVFLATGNNGYFSNNFTTSDQLEDTPTDSADDGIGNYITLNPNDRNNTSLVLTEGNTYLTASGDGGIKGTIFVDSGEHHFEYVAVSTTTNNMSVGVTLATSSLTNETPTTGDYAFNIRNGTEGGRAYDIFANGVTIATGSLPAAPNGKNIGVVFDADAGTLKFYNADLAASGDLIYTISSIPAGAYTVLARSSNNTHIFNFNFGQRPFVDSNLNNANAIATQNLPDTHPLYTGTAAQYRAGSQIMSLSYTGTSGAETNTCQRQEIDASIIADQAFTKVRVKFGAHTSEPFGIDNAYIGTKAGSGNAWDFAATPSTLKNNTNIAFDVPQSGTLWSDWVDFSGNGTTNLIVSFNVTSDAAKSDMLRGSGVSGVTRHAKNSSDEAADLAPTGFTSNATNVGSVLAIEVQ